VKAIIFQLGCMLILLVTKVKNLQVIMQASLRSSNCNARLIPVACVHRQKFVASETIN
jgi:hypothetical protein